MILTFTLQLQQLRLWYHWHQYTHSAQPGESQINNLFSDKSGITNYYSISGSEVVNQLFG